uniref:RxLR effector protein n=1 Tax=Plectus sambesii TaxID=2011161 RepID=A0A914V9Z2_9BILA
MFAMNGHIGLLLFVIVSACVLSCRAGEQSEETIVLNDESLHPFVKLWMQKLQARSLRGRRGNDYFRPTEVIESKVGESTDRLTKRYSTWDANKELLNHLNEYLMIGR